MKRRSESWVGSRSLILAGWVFLMMAGVLFVACSGRSRADKLHEKGALFLKHRKYYDAIEQS